MKFLCFTLILISTELNAQFRSDTPSKSYSFGYPIFPSAEKTFVHGVLADPLQNAKQISPLLTNFYSSDWRQQNFSFWTGTVTTMSFNKGKFGTLYYWDVQGNLRGARSFIDISGKNKRGFKLVLPPWRKF